MTIEKALGTQHTTTHRKAVIKRSLLIGFFVGLVVTIYSYLIVGFLCGWFVFILAHNIQCAYLKIELPVPNKHVFVEEDNWWKYHPYNPASPTYESNNAFPLIQKSDSNHYFG